LLQHILALARKELLALVRDRRGRFVLIGPPIAQLLVFGFAATYDLQHAAVAIYDEDRGQVARELIAHFQGSRNFELVATLTHAAEVAPLIDNREALLILHIGPGFSGDVLRGDSGALQLILDGRNSNTAMLAMNYVRTIVTDFNLAWARRHAGPEPPVKLETSGC
jgi:ABC-2 type transport system permease protein